ncbi:DUF4905 domain-containing protein [Roseivirga thermotolerans]|uniref:DUF4905 domain-containing protein n=1 Tax=Roseivirga thermotolerans TaxID=1758176 RepID=UPI00273F2F45|nr:DUF4905 domain-containing protein [Roseivirga thermotolerans]
MSSVLNLKFSQPFESPVWEVKCHDDKLLINTRNHENFHSAFALVDLKNKELLWQGLEFEDPWWVSAYHLYNNVVVFQKFEDTQNIESRSVFGFDLQKQEVVWSLENVKLLGAQNHLLYLTMPEAEEKLSFDVLKGDWTEAQKVDREVPLEQYPVHYEVDNPHFETLARFLDLKAGLELKGSCDYLEASGTIFIAANHVMDELKALTLCVFDESGNLLLRESLDSGVKGLVSGAFFIVQDALIFVTGKNELKIYSIDEKN